MMYARPGHRVLVTPKGDMLVRPSPLEIKMAQACKAESYYQWLDQKPKNSVCLAAFSCKMTESIWGT